MELDHLMNLYVEELKDVYSAEKQLLQALPKMASKAAHDELRVAFEDHEAITQEQVKRLETIFDDLKMAPGGKKCHGMEGLLKEGEEVMAEKADPDVLDAAMISAAQRVEHYEIAAYGTLRTYANQLGFKEHAQLLQKTLDEEGNTDKLLTNIAERRVNRDAEVGR
ncbi:MAG TPA: ferritin-like domain-containing protein [Longimicrobiales bacterium]|nr:ferritin-like domain-containing protein [Longimicrobiales bacterium]